MTHENENIILSEIIKKLEVEFEKINLTSLKDDEAFFLKQQTDYSFKHLISIHTKMQISLDCNEYYLLLCTLAQSTSQCKFWLNKCIEQNTAQNFNPVTAMIELKKLSDGVTFSLNVINYQRSIAS